MKGCAVKYRSKFLLATVKSIDATKILKPDIVASVRLLQNFQTFVSPEPTVNFVTGSVNDRSIA
jgi:hypothetical protein